MYKIVTKKSLNPTVTLMEIDAPLVARKAEPGQFIIFRATEDGERIPLTICDYDREKGTVEIVVQAIGAETHKLSKLKAGDYLADVVGPLGKPSDLCEESVEDLKKKKIVFIAGGVGTAPVYPQAKWLKEQGVECDVIIGAKTKDLVIMEERFKKVCNLHITTDDGSYGRSGMVTKALQDLWDEGNKYDHSDKPAFREPCPCRRLFRTGVSTHKTDPRPSVSRPRICPLPGRSAPLLLQYLL